MRHRRGGAGEGLRSAQADREICDLERVEEGERFFLAALQVEREGRAGAEAIAPKDIGLGRAFLEKAEVTDLLDLRVAAQEIADLRGIFAGAAHPQLERLEA